LERSGTHKIPESGSYRSLASNVRIGQKIIVMSNSALKGNPISDFCSWKIGGYLVYSQLEIIVKIANWGPGILSGEGKE
jgi:hypothetical protein